MATADSWPGGIEVRPFRDHEDDHACVGIQREVWGREFDDIVPPALLKVSRKIGGVSAGAFDGAGRLLGFVFGMTGVERGRVVHWSHMLAVLAEARNHGIGRRLKEFQREQLRSQGVETIYWTFDPLVARNAHLNLTRLATQVVEYVPDMYGWTGSELHTLGTDRLVVAWRTGDSAAAAGTAAGTAVGAGAMPVVHAVADGAGAPASALPLDPVIGIEIPADIDAVLATSAELGKRWREATRQAFLWYLERDYRVSGFRREADAGRCFYVLTAPGSRGG